MKAIIILLLLTLQLQAGVKYTIPASLSVLVKSDSVLKTQVGVTEKTGNNDGEVEKYLKFVGLGKGYPYCAAGQLWCFGQVTKQLPYPKSALALTPFLYAKSKGNLVQYKPEPYDLIIWNTPGTSNGHIERIVLTGQGGWVTTVGFNTSSGVAGNQRDGGGVYYRKRNLFHVLGRMQIKGLVGWIKI